MSKSFSRTSSNRGGSDARLRLSKSQLTDLRNKKITRRFQSGRRLDEAKHIGHSTDSKSMSDEDDGQNLFQELELDLANHQDYDELVKSRKKNRATVRVPIPRSIVNTNTVIEVSKGDDLLGNKSSQSVSDDPNEESKSDIKDDRINLFEFDITQTIKDLVKRYFNKINLEYYTYQIENLESAEV